MLGLRRAEFGLISQLLFARLPDCYTGCKLQGTCCPFSTIRALGPARALHTAALLQRINQGLSVFHLWRTCASQTGARQLFKLALVTLSLGGWAAAGSSLLCHSARLCSRGRMVLGWGSGGGAGICRMSQVRRNYQGLVMAQ